MSVIECVANVSEGRVLASVDAIAEAVARVGGIYLLDRSSDPAHNRSVLTFAGARAPLLDAVERLFAAAIPLIDLRTHRGEHPRMGAVDVVPFVPLAGALMTECVALAHEAGDMIATRFGVPVYFYAEAATSPSRTRLEDVRRGGFEQLALRMATAEWRPDAGPARPHPTAGATAVGARGPLIAFNVNLATSRIEVAKEIARRVRESSGGMRHVKALGLTLADRGVVQVSMNLTNYQATPIDEVFDRIAGYAKDLGVDIAESEIVGLIPEGALARTTPEHLRLRGFSTDKILEERLRAAGA